MVDGLRHARLDRGRDRVRPDVGETERAEEAEGKQRERHERHERPEGDGGREGEEAVPRDGVRELAAELERDPPLRRRDRHTREMPRSTRPESWPATSSCVDRLRRPQYF